MEKRISGIVKRAFWIIIILAVIAYLLISYAFAHARTPTYRVESHNLPINLENMSFICCFGKIDYISNSSTAQLEYQNGTEFEPTILIDNRPVFEEASYASITKTLYSNGSVAMQAVNSRLIDTRRVLNIISNNGTIIQANLSDNTTELYVATDNGTIFYANFNGSKAGNASIPPENNANGTANQSQNSSAPVHLVFLINRFRYNVTDVAFYIYGNYSLASSTAIAQKFLALGINNFTITNVTWDILN